MFLRVANSFADFKQNHRCKYFFFCLSFRPVIQKMPNWGFVSPEVLSERLKKFYQELRKLPTEHYSASAHLSIRAAIDRYLNTLPEFKYCN